MNGVFLYFKLLHYTASTYAQYVWQKLLPLVFAEPLAAEGTSVFQRVIDERVRFFANPPGFLTGECLTSELCFPPMDYSLEVRTFDPILMRDEQVVNLESFDFILVAAFNGYYQYVNWLRSRLPHKPILLVQDDAIEEMQYCHSSLQQEIIDAMQVVDGFVSYQKEMTGLAKALCPDVITVHHPMLPSFCPTPKSVTEKDLVCIGIGCWNYDFMNLLTAISALRRLRADLGPEIRAEFLGVHDYQLLEYKPFLDREGVVIKGWSKYNQYYEDLARYDVIFNLNGRAAAGRVSAEAALLGIPVVGNVLADMQEYCWPGLSVNKYDAHQTYLLCRRLLRDQKFRTMQVQLSRDRIATLKASCTEVANAVLALIRLKMSKAHA